MGATPRVCPHCLVWVTSSPGATLDRCPRCRRPLRPTGAGRKSLASTGQGRAAPPPLPASTVARPPVSRAGATVLERVTKNPSPQPPPLRGEGEPELIASLPRRRKVHPGAALAV